MSEYQNVRFVWVKGHSSNKENNRCDILATEAADGFELDIDEGYEKFIKENKGMFWDSDK